MRLRGRASSGGRPESDGCVLVQLFTIRTMARLFDEWMVTTPPSTVLRSIPEVHERPSFSYSTIRECY